ncbi:MAG: ATP-dependent DNA helicase [Desulfarculales bacterium]|nr:ATP-dependent DNA helicase [Desulfarculales bacterium]
MALGAKSPLSSCLTSFQPRPEQLTMALAISRAFADSTPLVAQIGTGTGKTLGYLTPAVLSGLKVIISTGTKTLQEQISLKELPLLQKTLAPDLRWAVLKGRANYLCARRAQIYFSHPELPLNSEGAGAMLQKFRRDTQDGDLDQIRDFLPAGLAEEITSTSEQCQGAHCPERDNCFLMEARRKASLADIAVVNHHLFMADLALKSQGHGQILPRWQAAIFDEAHLLPEIATQAFGVQISQQRVMSILRDIARESSQPALLAAALMAARQAADNLFISLTRLLGRSPGVGLSKKHLKILRPHLESLENSLQSLIGLLGGSEHDENLAARAGLLGQDLQSLPNSLPGHSVAWARTKGNFPAMLLSPIEIGAHLQEYLYSQETRLVFTSATLAPLSDLTPFRRRMGLPTELAVDLSLPSPFDLARQALLYVPRSLPAPGHPLFSPALWEELNKLLFLSQGRAFVLFTTHRNLEQAAAQMKGKLPFPLLVQGQAPKLMLLRQFIEHSPAVLLGTASFWQGVDIPGPSLSAVIVDKLPFAPPDDPLIAARCQLAEEEGKSGFAHILLPEAILSLKQGLGRLIRSPQDRGLLAVLDSRVWSKNYGKRFLQALRPVPVTEHLQAVEEFFSTSSLPVEQ